MNTIKILSYRYSLKTTLNIFCCYFLLPFNVFTISAPLLAAAQTSASTETTNEITINGPVSLKNLRQEIEKAEEAFLFIFNELNDDARFDVQCQMVRRPGSRLKQHQCTTNYFQDAMKDEADILLKQIGAVGFIAPGPGRSILPHYNSMFKEKIEEAINQSPEFVQAIEHFEYLREVYEDQRKEVFEIE